MPSTSLTDAFILSLAIRRASRFSINLTQCFHRTKNRQSMEMGRSAILNSSSRQRCRWLVEFWPTCPCPASEGYLMLIGLLSGGAIGCVWGWLLGSCEFRRLKRPFWSGLLGAISAGCIAAQVHILTSRSALVSFFIATAVMLPIRASCGR